MNKSQGIIVGDTVAFWMRRLPMFSFDREGHWTCFIASRKWCCFALLYLLFYPGEWLLCWTCSCSVTLQSRQYCYPKHSDRWCWGRWCGRYPSTILRGCSHLDPDIKYMQTATWLPNAWCSSQAPFAPSTIHYFNSPLYISSLLPQKLLWFLLSISSIIS